MKCYKFDAILQKNDWLEPAYVQIESDGKISALSNQPDGMKNIESISGWLLPGFQNAHSHAFQYAMAGLTEYRATGSNDFWSWREAMYDLALRVDPDSVRKIATHLYVEMAKMGFTAVAEFHYLHHDATGKNYENSTAMAEGLFDAAAAAGIRLTLIPVYYQRGDFGEPASVKQRRFLFDSVEVYLRLVESIEAKAADYSARCGAGIHSMRAVAGEEIPKLFASLPAQMPKHLHVAEHRKEVEHCLSHLGKRPVQWLLDNLEVNDSYHFVHSIHVDESEVKEMVKAGVNVVLCPSTEANLGDGIFPLESFWNAGGHWSIGTDSQIGLNPWEELRWADYGQRLIKERRNPLCRLEGEESGENIFRETLQTGRRAMGDFREEFFEVGRPLDAIVVDNTSPLLEVVEKKHRLSTLIYASAENRIKGLIVGGQWKVQEGCHPAEESSRRDLIETLRRLKNRI